ncbi:MAG: 16S rRNA (guanine(527)-N(7))-methyltransferase RsmG [Rhodobacteraceae bacterium]|nr:16S rRNA (guanine(527)-N(7))-methyltransferase RsmG [Paracoccaceae bacterium]
MGSKLGADLNVSRETMDRLKLFEELVLKWSGSINLISNGDQNKVWLRHIRDSMQIYPLLPNKLDSYADFGTGGGFPGLVLAILLDGGGRRTEVHLVESDKRKSVFLRNANRELGLKVSVYDSRIESVALPCIDVVTARALAPLDTLLKLASAHINKSTICIFPKGRAWKKDVENARKQWNFKLKVIKSKTQAGAVILKMGSISCA